MIKKTFIINALLISSTIFATSTDNAVSSDVFTHIAALHTPALAKQKNDEVIQADAIKKQNTEAARTDIYKVQEINVGAVEKIELFYRMFNLQAATANRSTTIRDGVFDDLETFAGDKPNFEHHVFGVLDNTMTTAGKLMLQRRLYQPSSNLQILNNWQNAVKTVTNKLMHNDHLIDSLEKSLTKLNNAETEFAWFFKELEEDIKKYFDTVYIQKGFIINDPTSLNQNQHAMQALATWNLFSDVTTVFMPEILGAIISATIISFATDNSPQSEIINQLRGIIDPFMYRANLSRFLDADTANLLFLFWSLNKVMLCFNIYKAVQRALENLKIMQRIEEKMHLISDLMNACEEIATLINESDLKEHFEAIQIPAKNYLATTSSDFDATIRPLKSSNPPMLTKGKSMAGFKQIDEAKLPLLNKLKFAGTVDSMLSTAKLMVKHTKTAANFCFPKYVQADKPQISITNFWHPFINPDTVVTNSISLGTNAIPQTLVITGPNAGGKSTALRAIMYCTLLAQTLGIAPATSMSLTPFSNLDTYLNIADTEGKESLFQAELNRTHKLLQNIGNLQSNQFSFVIMDEIFTGTNAKDGMAGAYGVTSGLSNLPNSIAIIATHFTELTEIAKNTALTANYKVSISKNAEGKIIPHYKLEPGISDQAIGVDLLAQAGFSQDIVLAAQAALARIKK